MAAAECPLAEITLRSEAGLQAISVLSGTYPYAVIGAGTVRTVPDAQAAIAAGAQFVVSPGTNVTVIEFCRSVAIPIVPGACTPTEVDVAVGAGAEVVKFFPAEAMGGIPMLRALGGPFRTVSFVPTGGIGPANLADYLSLPNVLACGGSWMVAPALLAERRFERIEELTCEALAIAANALAERQSHEHPARAEGS